MNFTKRFLLATLFCITILVFSACNRGQDNEKSGILNQTTLDKIDALETENNIIINYCDVPIEDEIDGEYVLSSNAEEIEEAVEAAETILSRLPDDWATIISNPEVIIYDEYKIEKVHLVFCDYVKSKENENGAEYLMKGTFYYRGNNEICYLIDIHNYEPEIAISETLVQKVVKKIAIDEEIEIEVLGADGSREHRIENSFIRRYSKYNPEGFEYYKAISEVKEEDKQYVYGSADDLNKVYFVNEEALYSEYFDLVQTVSPLLYTDKDDELPEVYQSEHIKNKAILAVDSINEMFAYKETYLESWFE